MYQSMTVFVSDTDPTESHHSYIRRLINIKSTPISRTFPAHAHAGPDSKVEVAWTS